MAISLAATILLVVADEVALSCQRRLIPWDTGKSSPSTAFRVRHDEHVIPKEGMGGEVDVLLAYDQSAVSWLQDRGMSITNFSLSAVEKVNQVFANTGIDASCHLRLVDIYEGTGRVGSDLGGALDSIVYDEVYENGFCWNVLKQRRDEVGADLVILLTDTGSARGATGLGYSLTASALENFSEWAFSVCAVRAVDSGLTLAHEIGHLFGAGHSDVQAIDPGPQLDAYSSGYYFPVGGNFYHTVMAYDTDGVTARFHTELPFFSSPDYSYQGVPLGDADHDNSRTIARMAAIVAAFRPRLREEGVSAESNLMPEAPSLTPSDSTSSDSGQGAGGRTENDSRSGGVQVISSNEIFNSVSIQKAVIASGCVLDIRGNVVGRVELRIAKEGVHGSKVTGGVQVFGARKLPMKTNPRCAVRLSTGPADMSFIVAKSGTMTIRLGGLASGDLAFTGTWGDFVVTSALLGGEALKSVAFKLNGALPASIKGGMVNTDYLPNGEPVKMERRRWVIAKAASIKYARDHMTNEWGWILNNGRKDPSRTNLSGLRLTYTVRTGSFKGMFTVYTLNDRKMKKVTAVITGILVDGIGYGMAMIKGIDACPVIME